MMFAVEEPQILEKEIVATKKFVPQIHRLRVTDYEKMIAHGIFTEDDKIELWEGVLVEMSPKGIKHSVINDQIARYFIKHFDEQAFVRNQNPIKLDDYSEPEPDIVLAHLPLAKYYERLPTPHDIYAILEIADTTLASDRVKARAYARNGITQYLILNLNARELEDYREPAADGYRRKQTYMADESFSLVAFPEIEIKVSELLPPQRADALNKDLTKESANHE